MPTTKSLLLCESTVFVGFTPSEELENKSLNLTIAQAAFFAGAPGAADPAAAGVAAFADGAIEAGAAACVVFAAGAADVSAAGAVVLPVGELVEGATSGVKVGRWYVKSSRSFGLPDAGLSCVRSASSHGCLASIREASPHDFRLEDPSISLERTSRRLPCNMGGSFKGAFTTFTEINPPLADAVFPELSCSFRPGLELTCRSTISALSVAVRAFPRSWSLDESRSRMCFKSELGPSLVAGTCADTQVSSPFSSMGMTENSKA